MHESLRPVERRVLGVLLEKSLAQPSYYPMTLNAIVNACNQKSNRDPAMNLNEDAVWDALDALRECGLVARMLAGMSGRVDRFKHEAKTHFGWEKPQRAVMAELLLRGPQTVGELRSRCARMYPFENTSAITAVIEGLSLADPPLVSPMPRAAGRSATRYAHRLYPESEQPAAPEPTPAPAAAEAAQSTRQMPAADEPFHRELEEMQAEIADLHQAVADLRRRLDTIEQQP